MERTILVLSGGGMKGMAHVGAWKAIREAGIGVAEIVGTSVGALVGACIAGGQSWRELAPRALAVEKSDIAVLNRWAVLWKGIRQPSVLLDGPFRRHIESVLPVEDFEGLELPLQINAVDLERGTTEWFGAGGRTDVPVVDAVYASCALPVFWPPAEIDGRSFVDGAVLDGLALGRAAERGADRVIAIDVAASAEADSADAISDGMIGIHKRVFDIVAAERRRELLDAWREPPLTYVRPELDRFQTLDFAHTQQFLEEGYRATRQALAEEGLEVTDAEVPPEAA